MNTAPQRQTDLTAEQWARFGDSRDPRHQLLQRMDPETRLGLFRVDTNNNGIGGQIRGTFSNGLTPEEQDRVRQDPNYERIRRSIPGYLSPGSQHAENIAGAATLALQNELTLGNLTSRAWDRFMQNPGIRSFFSMIGGVFDAAMFKFGITSSLSNESNQDVARGVIERVAANTGARMTAMGFTRDSTYEVMQGLTTSMGQSLGLSAERIPLAQAIPVLRNPPRAEGSLRTAPDVQQGVVVARQEDLTEALALGSHIRGLEIHGGTRRAMAADGTTPLVSDRLHRDREQISENDIVILIARGRQGENNPVYQHLRTVLTARHDELKQQNQAPDDFETYFARAVRNFDSPNSREVREFRTILLEGNSSIQPYLRSHLNRDIQAGRISAETAQDLRSRGVQNLTVAELRADIEARGIVFQQTMADLRRATPGISNDALVARTTEQLTQALAVAPRQAAGGGNDIATNISRPATDVIERHQRAVAMRAPLEEAQIAVSTLATQDIRRMRNEFVGQEIAALRPMILANPAQFGLSENDPRLQRLQNGQALSPNEPSGIARITLTPQALQAAGIDPSQLRASSAVNSARLQFRAAEAQFMRQMPEEVLTLFRTDQATGRQVVQNVLEGFAQQHGRNSSLDGRVVETTLGIRGTQQLRDAVQRAGTRVVDTRQPSQEPGRRTTTGEVATPPITVGEAQSRSPLDQALQIGAEMAGGISASDGKFSSPGATPAIVSAENDARPERGGSITV